MRTACILSCSIAAVAGFGLAACGQGQAGSGEPFKRRDARLYVLAPSDLGRGYKYGDDSFCGGFSPEEMSKEFTDFVLGAKPVGCGAEIDYVWGGARTTVVPRGVESGAVVFDDEDDARRGMELREDLIQFVTGESPRDFSALPDFGHDAVLFRNGGFDVPVGAGVFWRNGNMLDVVFARASGLSAETARPLALKLARQQQSRIENPKSAPPQEDDPELPLDDPALDAPVYWLGREFKPKDLPSLTFSGAHTYGGARGEPTFTAELDYGNEDAHKTYGVKVLVFEPSAFRGFERSLLGRLVRDTPCSEATKVTLPQGHAIIWGGFAKPTRPPCPSRPYDRYFAHVYLEGAVVTVNNPFCLYPCLAIPRGTGDPYNTPRGLEAIARGVRIRPTPT